MNTQCIRALLLVSMTASAAFAAAEKEPINPAPTLSDWQAMAKLPDLGGVWTPLISDQVAQERTDMLITHNAFEILLTPGRVMLLGEGDGNRMRRIYTDGRSHPADPDPSFHGHSIGHWEGQTLVVDTIAVLPQSYLAVNEAVGVPNNGDMHIVERIHLLDAHTLADDLEITANKLLSKTWKTTRKYIRQRAQKFDIVEGVCEQGSYNDAVDKDGNAIFAPIKFHNGVPVGSDTK
jgi:hypothetical protein